MPELILFDTQRFFARCAKCGQLLLRVRRAAWLVACGIAFGGATDASAGQACRPALTIANEQLSPMLPPTLGAEMDRDRRRRCFALRHECGLFRSWHFAAERVWT